MPDGVNIPGGPSFAGTPQPPDVPCDPTSEAWRGEPGPVGPMGPAGPDSNSVVSVLDHGAKGDGTTDDTAAIQAVLNAYAGKASVFIPDTGHPYMVNSLNPPTGSDILLNGTLKTLPIGGNPIWISHAGNITIRGHGVIDGNGAAIATGTLACLECDYGTNVAVYGITLQNARNWPLNVTHSSGVLVSDVTMLHGRNASEFAAGCDDCWLMNCTIDGPDNDIGFSFYGGVTNSGAIGNVVKNSGVVGGVTAVGINVLGDAGQTAPCSNIVIANNIIHDCSGSGLQVFTDQAGLHHDIIITGNRCSNNGRSGIGNRGDIDISHCVTVLVTGNHSSNFGNGGSNPWWGLYAGAGASGISFVGNMVYGTGQGGTAGVGLMVASADTLIASGNFFFDNAATPSMAAAISGTAGAESAFINNYCGRRPVTLTTLTDTVIGQASNGQWQFGNEHDVAVGIKGARNTNRLIAYETANSPRWYVGAVGPDETGSNVGSDFNIISCNDAGAALTTPLAINRASGKITTALPLTITTIGNFTNDATAAAGGTPIGGMYRNGSVVQIRVV